MLFKLSIRDNKCSLRKEAKSDRNNSKARSHRCSKPDFSGGPDGGTGTAAAIFKSVDGGGGFGDADGALAPLSIDPEEKEDGGADNGAKEEEEDEEVVPGSVDCGREWFLGGCGGGGGTDGGRFLLLLLLLLTAVSLLLLFILLREY